MQSDNRGLRNQELPAVQVQVVWIRAFRVSHVRKSSSGQNGSPPPRGEPPQGRWNPRDQQDVSIAIRCINQLIKTRQIRIVLRAGEL